MLNSKAKKYQTPRLHTYGKLQDLTKGSQTSGMDAASFKETTP